MNVITIEHATFQHLIERLDTIEKAIQHSAEDLLQKTWLSGKQVLSLLSVSRRTLQNYRDAGKIGFSQVGNKFYYPAADVEAHLQNHYQPPTHPKWRNR